MIINEFLSVGGINDYTMTALEHSHCVAVDTPELLFMFEQLSGSQSLEYRDMFRQIAETGDHSPITADYDHHEYAERLSFIKDNDNFTEMKIVYPYSKTNFRKVVHPTLPPSLYKHYFHMLQFGGIVEKANGQLVVMNRKPIDSTMFLRLKDIQTPLDIISDDISKKLQTILDRTEDIDYYRSIIDSLTEEIYELHQTNHRLQNELNNKTIATWY